MKRVLVALDAAFAYFSIVPVRRTAMRPAPDAAALVALPFVGATVGAVSGTAAWLLSRVAPQRYVVATAFALPVILSGALHVDGFLDCSDAIFASASPARRLEIMQDPRHGTYAVVALTLASVFTLAALGECRPAKLPVALAFSGALARLAAVSNAAWLPYGRAASVTRAFESRPSRAWLAAQALATMALARYIAPRLWITVPAAFTMGAIVARRIALQLGGGLTGDAYGFLIVLLEPGIIAAVAALDRR